MGQIDKEFLEKILGRPVSSFELSQGTKLGDNVAGSLTSIKVTLASGEKLDLLHKGYSDDPEFKDLTIQFGMFTIENATYSTVVPGVVNTLKQAGLSESDAQLPVPKYLGGNGDFTTGDEFVLMEDARPEGYAMQDKYRTLDLEETSLVLKELGRFHASSYFWLRHEGEKVLDNPALARIKHSPYSSTDPAMVAMGTEMFRLEVTSAVKLLSHFGHEDLSNKLKSKLLDMDKRVLYDLGKHAQTLTDKSTFACIIHGDLWMNNILMKYDDKGKPVSLKILDFQQVRRGNIYEDLSYFLFTSTTAAFRKNHLVQVLNTYYESFASTLDSLACPLPIGFTRGKVIDMFYSNMLPAYAYLIFAIPFQLAEPVSPEEKREFMAKNAKQNEQAGSPPPDPQAMSPEQLFEMMLEGMKVRNVMVYQKMLKTPKAVERLVQATQEMADMKLI